MTDQTPPGRADSAAPAVSRRGLAFAGRPPTGTEVERLLAPVDAWLAEAARSLPGLAGFDLDAAVAAAEHDWLSDRGELRHLEVQPARAPRRGAVVFAHGLGDHVRRSLPLADGLARAGWDVVMADRRGHGLSEGRRGDARLGDDFALLEAAIAYARRRFGGPVVLFGDSLGGIIAWYLLTHEPDVDAAVCHCIAHPQVFPDRAIAAKAPLTRALARVAPLAPVPITQIADYSQVGIEPLTRSYFDERLDPLFSFAITARAAASLSAFRPPLAWQEVELPVLVTIGTADGLVRAEFVERCLARAEPPGTTYLPLEGLGHQLYLEHLDRALPPVVDWLDATTEPPA